MLACRCRMKGGNMDYIMKRDLLAGASVLLIGILLVFVLIPIGVDEPSNVEFAALAPSYYPRFVGIAMMLLGLAIAVRSIYRPVADDMLEVPESVLVYKAICAIAIMFATAIFVSSVGFILVGAAALLALMLLAGERNPVIIAAAVIGLPLLLYFFFTKLANIPIPEGVLEPVLIRI